MIKCYYNILFYFPCSPQHHHQLIIRYQVLQIFYLWRFCDTFIISIKDVRISIFLSCLSLKSLFSEATSQKRNDTRRFGEIGIWFEGTVISFEIITVACLLDICLNASRKSSYIFYQTCRIFGIMFQKLIS
jgi:hypothetical protein